MAAWTKPSPECSEIHAHIAVGCDHSPKPRDSVLFEAVLESVEDPNKVCTGHDSSRSVASGAAKTSKDVLVRPTGALHSASHAVHDPGGLRRDARRSSWTAWAPSHVKKAPVPCKRRAHIFGGVMTEVWRNHQGRGP